MGKKCFTSLLLISAFLLMVLLTACNDTPTGSVAPTATLTPIEKTTVSSATSTAITQFTPKINATPTPTYQYYDGTTVKTGPDPTGKIILTKDGGANWIELYSESPENHNLIYISCPTTNVCYAQAEKTLITEDGGATWQQRPTFANMGLKHFECPGPTICYAWGDSEKGGTDIQVTADSSKTWKSVKDANYYKAFEAFEAFTCATPVNCIGTGRLSLRTDDGGKSWQSIGGLDDDSAAISLSCPAINICFGAGGSDKPKHRLEGNGYITSTTDAGKTWNNQFFDDVPGGLQSISCPGSTICYAVGYEYGSNSKSNILATKDGGQNWIRQPFNPDIPTGLTKIACTDVTNCISIGYEMSRPYHSPAVVITKDGGNTWIKQTSNFWKQKDTLLDVSCPATNICFAILKAA